jgi:uncharacterized cupin superfamily protein
VVVHLDDVPAEAIDRAVLRGTRWRVGPVAGCVRVGLSRYRLGPGERAMPVHVHADEEELFVVLAGSGLSWQDGRTWAVAAGDVVLHRAGGAAHTIVGAETGGLDALAFGSGSATGLTWLPRAGAFWAGPHWVPPAGPDPFAAEDAAGPLELPPAEPGRPPTIVAIDELEAEPWGEGDVATRLRDPGGALGTELAGLSVIDVEPGRLSGPPHCHSAEEELFVVARGEGTLLLGDEEHPVRRGSVVARPAGTGVAHAFRAAPGGLRLLAYGQRDTRDMTFYPRSQKVALRGLGVRFAVDQVGYWEGEP